MKRFMDLLLTFAAAPVVAVLLPPLAAAVGVCGGRPVFFRQSRVGFRGKAVLITKLRTMTEAPKPSSGRVYEERGRVTRLGAWLRGLHLDELPQLWLVLRGDLSWVGPRPLLPEHMARCPDPRKRQEAKPGLTGLAQLALYERRFLSVEEGFGLDLFYVEHASLGLDLQIIGRTVAVHARRLARC